MEVENSAMEMKQLFFNNLQLLGFDSATMEATHRIPFNKLMFELPNKRGAEIVLHFLFQRLNPALCKEAFRDSWPILDKKREQTFRKTCCNWLTNILKEEPECLLPRINASLFMSPGGEKFYQLLLYFSGYVLQRVIENELGVKQGDGLKHCSLTSQNQSFGEVILKGLSCSSIRHRNQYLATVQTNVQANTAWKESADEYVKEYRKLSKEVRELEYKLREEEQKAVQASLARGSPVKRKGNVDHFDPENDPKTIRRSQQIQQVRDMWKQLEDFDRAEEAEREVVESIVEKTVNKHRLDAGEISVKVPDMLLRECQDEIRRRNVDNTYKGGKLNLVSVLQLWNLSLHLYLEKLHEVGVPKFEEDVKKLTSQSHIQQKSTHNAQKLRQQMAESIPKLKASVERLREKLDHKFFQEQSPESIRTTSVGLGLVHPSPMPNFSPGAAVTPEGGVGVTSSPKDVLDTPEAARQIAEEIREKVRKGPDQLFKQPDLRSQRVKDEMSSVPKPVSAASSRQSSRPSSARSTTSSKGSKMSNKSTPKSKSSIKSQKLPQKSTSEQNFPEVSSPRTMMEKLSFRDDNDSSMQNIRDTSLPLSARSDSSVVSDKTLTPRSNQSSPRSSRSLPRSARSQVSDVMKESRNSTVNGNSKPTGRKTPTDMLVAEIMGEAEILSPLNSGLEAFESRDVVRRTPDLPEDGHAPTPPNSETAEANPATPPNSETVDRDVNCTTPPNSEIQEEVKSSPEDNNKIVNVTGPEMEDADFKDMDNDMGKVQNVEDIENKENVAPDSRQISLESILMRARLVLGDQIGSTEAKNESFEGEGDRNSGENFDNHYTESLREGKEIMDDIVDEMIQEGIRQATEEDGDVGDGGGDRGDSRSEEDVMLGSKQDHLISMNGQLNGGIERFIIADNLGIADDDYGEDGIEEIKGPDLVEAYDDNDDDQGSVRSTEELIVIDRSIHLSPKHAAGRSPRDTADSPVMFIADEKCPEFETSLHEAIIVDKSFHGTPLTGKSTAAAQARSMLSKSLTTERSPLSDEIRRMFQKAVADTPPPRPSQVSARQEVTDDNLEMPNMDLDSRCDLQPDDNGCHGNAEVRGQEGQGHGLNDILQEARSHFYGNKDDDKCQNRRNILQEADISWDMTDTLDDIDLPDIDLDGRSDLDIENFEGVKDLLSKSNDQEIDELFASNTPQFPKTLKKVGGTLQQGSTSFTKGQGHMEMSLHDDDDELLTSMQMPHPENEGLLISFTP